jgi:dimethylhistidine N-methyltransferase
MSLVNSRVSSRMAAVETSTSQFAQDVRYYLSLTPRQLPSRYLYDPLGSALFDAICRLPWYGLTRAESRLLTEHAASIFSTLRPLTRIVELGSGTGEKLATLLASGRDAYASVQLHLIDVSAPALDAASRALSAFEDVTVVTHQAPYEIGLEELRRDTRAPGRTLAMFLGSNIGNFDPAGRDELLCQIRGTLDRGDAFLIGADLVKPRAALLVAYDDPLQVTAAFNRNLLVRINRELGADFDLDAYRHQATWNEEASRIEMHLVATRRQNVNVPAAGLAIELQAGETIWTESSYKFRADAVVTMLERNGFRLRAQWIDAPAQFALTLVEAV